MDSRQKSYWLNKIKSDSDESILKDILLSEGDSDDFNAIYVLQEASCELKRWKKFDADKAWSKINRQNNKARFSIARYASAAAVILILGVSLLFFNSDDAYYAGNTERHLVLDDGSDIIMYPNSKLTVSNDFNTTERLVELKGDAYFNISKNKNKPFVVRMQKADIKVLGTVFYVEQYEQSVKVDLISGRVEIKKKDGQKAVLNKNETALINRDVEVKKLIEENIPSMQDLYLDDVSIRDAVNRLNSIYGKKIIELKESEDKLWDEAIHTTVKNSSIREFINGLKLIFNVKVINSKGKFIVSNFKMK